METPRLIRPEAIAHHIERFNGLYVEDVVNAVPDANAWSWVQENVPLFECDDPIIEEIYYFRWWIYRKHIKWTADGFVVTEFLPIVRHGGKHNTINCPLGHQLYDGRWIGNTQYLDEYTRFMLGGGGNPNAYTCWFADGVLQRLYVTGDTSHVVELLPGLVGYFKKWQEREKEGLFHHTPWMDGMEFSISGNQEERFRPAFNSYMYADAKAIAAIAKLAARDDLADEYLRIAAAIKARVQNSLWNSELEFFASRDLEERWMPARQPVREAVGYIPWYFNLPDAGYESAWKHLNDPQGFLTPIGLTTAEVRHPRFLKENPERLPTWDGPIWPFATSQTLTAMANLLRNYQQTWVSRADYMRELHKYAACHRREGKVNISEVVRDPYVAEMGGSQHYNHSTFVDLVITGLCGIVPQNDATVKIDPLQRETATYFAVQGVRYRGRSLSICWDITGERYGKRGFSVYVDEELCHTSPTIECVTVRMNDGGR